MNRIESAGTDDAAHSIGLSDADLADLAERRIPPERAADQIARMRAWQPWIPVERPATLDDGIQELSAFDPSRLEKLAAEAADAGRIGVFVPASGDATRLFERLARARNQNFADLDAVRAAAEAGDVDAGEAIKIIDNLDRMAMGVALATRGVTAGSSWQALIDALASPSDDSFSRLPKGLIPFHLDGDVIRTAVGEHLLDAMALGANRAVFTSQTRHTHRFDAAFDAMRDEMANDGRKPIDIAWKLQDQSYDAVALEQDGDLVREENGLLFRPGGHGVLIHALNDMQGDIVAIRNIDNVVHRRFKHAGNLVRRQMIGLVVDLNARIAEAISMIDAGRSLDDAMAPLGELLDWRTSEITGDDNARREECRRLLDRPLRVCGMVQDLNHKGGGPFWVERAGRMSLQIVEGANLDDNDPSQKARIGASTHFHPVDMIVSLKRADGSNYDLARHTDDDMVILTEKSRDGRKIKVFEYPGLWNGGMGRWNTVFVDIPAELFNPVKYLSDLLTDKHCG